ncbi:hypothetical protein TRVL_10195 [Trypanosoma vivax]|nr:hypothetical protein TRVL_10195 [Trypanosoma vivax]
MYSRSFNQRLIELRYAFCHKLPFVSTTQGLSALYSYMSYICGVLLGVSKDLGQEGHLVLCCVFSRGVYSVACAVDEMSAVGRELFVTLFSVNDEHLGDVITSSAVFSACVLGICVTF